MTHIRQGFCEPLAKNLLPSGPARHSRSGILEDIPSVPCPHPIQVAQKELPLALGKPSQFQLTDGRFEPREKLERRLSPFLELIPFLYD